MFDISDEFLASVGYDVETLSDERKQRYRQEINQELVERSIVEIVKELDEQQIEEMNDIQENPERARRWLDEFHGDYREREDYKRLLEGANNEDEAISFYAVALWMGYAVPGYGKLMQEQMQLYHDELVEQRASINAALQDEELQ